MYIYISLFEFTAQYSITWFAICASLRVNVLYYHSNIHCKRACKGRLGSMSKGKKVSKTSGEANANWDLGLVNETIDDVS